MNDVMQSLKQAVADSNITQVAKKMGIPRCTLSLVVNDKYPADPKNILARFKQVFSGIHCPYLNTELSREQCLEYSGKSRPSNLLGLQHWRACQHCEHKSIGGNHEKH